MLLNHDTKEIQSQVATYCRTGELKPIVGAREDRLPNYRRLIFNVINDTLVQAYPITYEILSEEEWYSFVNDYFINYNAQSPQIWKMPFEFYLFAKENNYNEKLDKAFLTDLLYFEWMEIEVHTMPDNENINVNAEGDMFKDKLIINPEHKLIQLTYPVHLKAWNELEDNAGEYYVLIYREQETGLVKFIDLSPFLALFFEQLKTSGESTEVILQELFNQIDKNQTDIIVKNVLGFLKYINELGLILGFNN